MAQRRFVAVGLAIVGALAFGAAMAAVHGSQGGVRATIGNLSAPWLLLAFGAGAALGRRGWWTGAVAGLLVTALGLGAFYVANIWVLGIFGHGAFGDLRFALSSGAYYLRLGLVSGPVLGALGALWRRRRSLGVALAATALLALEPLAWLAYRHAQLPQGFAAVAVAEVGAGIALAGALVAGRRRSTAA